MSKRFIVEKTNITVDLKRIIVKGEEVHHLNVLRYKAGDNVYINEYELKIEKIEKDKMEGVIVGMLPQKGIPKVDITLIQSYLKSDKMEYVVQKAVELGVKKIIPVITKNTVVKFDEKDKAKKLERLSKISKEAVEQCGRTDTVNIEEIQSLLKINFLSFETVLVCLETSQVRLKNILNNIKATRNIAVIIGPEGGLDNTEVEMILKNKNVIDVSLGERVLRAETASLSILSILGYELE